MNEEIYYTEVILWWKNTTDLTTGICKHANLTCAESEAHNTAHKFSQHPTHIASWECRHSFLRGKIKNTRGTSVGSGQPDNLHGEVWKINKTSWQQKYTSTNGICAKFETIHPVEYRGTGAAHILCDRYKLVPSLSVALIPDKASAHYNNLIRLFTLDRWELHDFYGNLRLLAGHCLNRRIDVHHNGGELPCHIALCCRFAIRFTSLAGSNA